MSLSPTSRRAEAFARLLDSGSRTDDPVAAPLLAVAGALTAIPAIPGPRPEFRQALRTRVLAVAAVQGIGETAAAPVSAKLHELGSSWKVQRRLMALAGGAAVVTAVAGVGVGASKSLPGDPFYGVKRASESVQLATTFGTEAKGKRHLEFARTRLAEVQAMLGRPEAVGPLGGSGGILAAGGFVGNADTKLITAALHDMDAQTKAGASDLLEAFRQSGSTEPLASLHRFVTAQARGLAALVPALPTTVRSHAAASLLLLVAVQRDIDFVSITEDHGSKSPGSKGTTPAGAPQGGSTTPGSTKPGSSSSPTGSSSPSSGTGSPNRRVPVPPLPTIPSLPLPTAPSSPFPSIPDLSSLLGGSEH